LETERLAAARGQEGKNIFAYQISFDDFALERAEGGVAECGLKELRKSEHADRKLSGRRRTETVQSGGVIVEDMLRGFAGQRREGYEKMIEIPVRVVTGEEDFFRCVDHFDHLQKQPGASVASMGWVVRKLCSRI
jgi:hypothetical protein